jgi:cytoskeletal protein RodZ
MALLLASITRPMCSGEKRLGKRVPMSINQLKRPFIAGLIVVFTLAFSAGTSWATEPCKDKPTTTTSAKPKSTTTTVNQTTTTTAKPKPQEVTTTTVKHQTSPQRPTTTTVEVATQEQIETTGEVNADHSIQPAQLASSSAPTELAQTGVMTTRLSLLGAALCGLGMIALWLRSRLVA